MPKAYLADNSRFRTAVLKEYCAGQHVEAVCMQSAAHVLDEILAAEPDVVFLHDTILQQRTRLIEDLRAQPPLARAVVVLVTSGEQSGPIVARRGIDHCLSSMSGLAQLDAVLQRLGDARPIALIVSSFVRASSPLCQLLAAEGFEVSTAVTGNRGLAQASAIAPAVILVDAKLADMPGVEFCKRLRAAGPLSSTPVWALLAKPDPAQEQACREASAQGVLLPPFNAPHNIARLRQAVPPRKPAP